MKIMLSLMTGLLLYPMLIQAGSTSSSPDLSVEEQRLSYAIGMELGAYYKSLGESFDLTTLARGIADGFHGREPLLEQKDIVEVETNFARRQQSLQMQRNATMVHDNAAAAYKFLSKNRQREGVKVTETGLQYEIIELGGGDRPLDGNRVEVEYTGTLMDGTVFDSTEAKGKPAVFDLDKAIPGFQEGLKLMPEGSIFKFYMPADLGYGDRGAGALVQPGAMLIYEVKLLNVF